LEQRLRRASQLLLFPRSTSLDHMRGHDVLPQVPDEIDGHHSAFLSNGRVIFSAASPMNLMTSTERLETLLRGFSGVLRNALARRLRGRPGIDLDELEQEARIRLWKAHEREKTIEHPPSYMGHTAVCPQLCGPRSRSRLRANSCSPLQIHERVLLLPTQAPRTGGNSSVGARR